MVKSRDNRFDGRPLVIDGPIRGIESAYVDAPLVPGQMILENAGYQVISLEENAKLRVREGLDSEVCTKGNYVMEGVIYTSDRGVFLTKKSPIIDAYRDRNKGWSVFDVSFPILPSQVEDALTHSFKVSDGGTGQNINKLIPIERIPDDPLCVWVFGTSVKDYSELLKEAGHREMRFWGWFDFDGNSKNLNHPYAKQIFFQSVSKLRSWHDFFSAGLTIEGNKVRGIKHIKEHYSPEQISQSLRTLNLTGLEKSILSNLRKRVSEI
jgi:hypothetical protein